MEDGAAEMWARMDVRDPWKVLRDEVGEAARISGTNALRRMLCLGRSRQLPVMLSLCVL